MWFRPPGIILTVWWGCGVLACLLACMQAGFRGWCRAVCGPLLGGGSRVRVLVVLAVLGRLLGLLPGCFPLPVPCPVLVLVGRCVCLSWPLACPRCSWCFPCWWPACRGACLHACMHAGFWGCCVGYGGAVGRCAGLSRGVPPRWCRPPGSGLSGRVLGLFWGVSGGWCGPGCPRGAGWRPAGEGAGGSAGAVCGFCGAVGPGGGPLGAREGPCPPGVHHG